MEVELVMCMRKVSKSI